MDYAIFNNINNYFAEHEYEALPTDVANVKMYGIYQKSCLYLVNIILLDKEHRFDSDMFEQYKDITRKQFAGASGDKVILLNLFLIEQMERIYPDINYCPDMEEDFVDINWIVDIKNKSLVIPKKQVNNVAGLEKILPKVIGEEVMEEIRLEKIKKVPTLTYALILMNILIWILMELRGGSRDVKVLNAFGAIITYKVVFEHEYWRLFTSIFLHFGLAHLAFNSFALYIFGGRVEKYLSAFQFLAIYIFSGVLGGAISVVYFALVNKNVIAVGASGAIYGLIGSIFIYSKLTNRTIEGLNAYIVSIYVLIGVVVSLVGDGGSISAHLGGFISGILISLTVISIRRLSRNEHRIH